MNLFAQIRKVDEEKRLVYGRAAEEVVDKSDEIMDYASSKPHFQKWSEEVAKDTDGKSLGNVRAMHGKVAAGKLTGIDFNDGEKAIDICAKVVDDAEWKKVLEGVYTGFSMGGAYVGERKAEKHEGRDVSRYTARPSEISLVDRPCIPTAKFFEVQKADGSLQKVEFAAPAETADEAEDVTVNGTADEIAALGKLMNANGLSLTDLIDKAVPAFLAGKKKKKGGKDGDGDTDGDTAADDPDADAKKEEGAEMAEAVEMTKVDGDIAADASLEKVEAALAEALAKVGARNSTADLARIRAIHEAAVALGAACEPAKAEEAVIEKLDASIVEKMVADAVAPLQKRLDEADTLAKAQAEKIEKLEAQPETPRIRLRAVSKAADVIADPEAKAEPTPVVDAHGEKHEIAGLIKSLHAGGGAPLLRKV